MAQNFGNVFNKLTAYYIQDYFSLREPVTLNLHIESTLETTTIITVKNNYNGQQWIYA